ncbi:hypothetical protein DH2020_027988 [Rehmannia glutinosa]|uniref:Rho GTPase-activating protein n=1 Tax=Rehmannia glutinosa TaxID=99300 RepID=A0ABR0VWD3_REHGL
MSASIAAFERPRIGNSNTIFKSGHLLISSKVVPLALERVNIVHAFSSKELINGLIKSNAALFVVGQLLMNIVLLHLVGLRLFKVVDRSWIGVEILEEAMSALPQRGGEVNLTLGGIDLNNSGSVVVREDKKLLTVLFPDGRDGRAFTLKAETSEDLYEWKTALENALAQAPNAALVMGHNGIFRSDTSDPTDGSFHQWREKRPVKSLVVGRPILLALEDIDGGPSFLEKALRFLEQYGIKVEGILRQSADVEEVDKRVQEYEQGKTEFDPDEDAHVIGDCVKHVLRELPSSPVPASCCTALLEAFSKFPLYRLPQINRQEGSSVNAMRSAIQEAFPEPNRRLLQSHTRRVSALCIACLKEWKSLSIAVILKIFHDYNEILAASEFSKYETLICCMYGSIAVAPLLAGECELEDDFDINGDNSAQLLAAANAANNAQAIITTLLEEYENIFDDDSLHRCSMSVDSQTDNSGSEDSSDDENPDIKVNGYHDAQNEVDPETDFDCDADAVGSYCDENIYSDLTIIFMAFLDLFSKYFKSDCSVACSHAQCTEVGYVLFANTRPSEMTIQTMDPTNNRTTETNLKPTLEPGAHSDSIISVNDQLKACENMTDASAEILRHESQRSMGEILSSMNRELHQSIPDRNYWLRKQYPHLPIPMLVVPRNRHFGEKKNACHPEIETAKNDLRHRIAKEARGNAILQASLREGSKLCMSGRLHLNKICKLRDLRAALLKLAKHVCRAIFWLSWHDSRAELEEIALAGGRRGQIEAERVVRVDLRNIKGQSLTSGSNSRLPSRKQLVESASLSDSKSAEASTILSVDDLCAVDSSTSLPSTSRVTEVMDYPRHPSAASSTLVELTTRLDFFKERRSQLMEQLHKLDLNYGSTPQDFCINLITSMELTIALSAAASKPAFARRPTVSFTASLFFRLTETDPHLLLDIRAKTGLASCRPPNISVVSPSSVSKTETRGTT